MLAFQLGLGWRLEHIAKGPALFTAYQLHKSVGITILLLTFGRVAIRFLHPRPAALADGGASGFLAKAVHALLYLIMLGGPLTGWLIVSTAKTKVPTLLFGLLPWPHLPVGAGLHEPAEAAHGLLAALTLLLVALHVVGAIRHQFFRNENLLGRMIPFLGSAMPSRGKSAVVIAGALLALWLANFFGWQSHFAPAAVVNVVGNSVDAAPANLAAPIAENADALPQNAVAAVVDEKQLDAPANAVAPVAKAAESVPVTAEVAKMPLSSWRVAPGGRLGFTAKWSDSPVDGTFGNWDADIKFSPDDLAGSSLKVSIDLASVSTGNGQYDEALKGAEFFGVGQHSRATYTANAFTHLGGDRYRASGTLDLHGVSQPLVLTFTLKLSGDSARVTGSSNVNRTKYGVGSGEYAATDQIGAGVAINFNFSAIRSSK